MVVLSGERISELERLSSCRAGDEFLVSRHYNLKSDRLFSRRIRYDDIVSDAATNLCAALHLSSAAFVEKTDYSRKNHGHDYSTVYVYARPLSAISAASGVKVYPESAEPVAMMDAVNNGVLCSVVMYNPGQRYDAIEDVPEIGELKFLARRTLPVIDVDSAEFDGWVYPDGSEYDGNSFPSAYAVYGDGQSGVFRVPFLSNFIKLNPGAEKSEPMKKFPAVNEALPAHTHEIPKDIIQKSAGKITVNVKLPGNGDDTPAKVQPSELLGAIHAGGTQHGTLDENDYEISNFKQANISIEGGACGQFGIDVETRPNFNLLPVMVYIGKKAGQRPNSSYATGITATFDSNEG